MRRKALSLIEILIAMVILSVALFALMIMNSSSNKGSMDAYYDLQAAQLAQEPLEILSAFGYRWLASPANQLADYPLNRWMEVSDSKRYSPEAMQFERTIELEPITEGPAKAIRIKVSVRPKEAERAKKWVSRALLVMQALVLESPR